MTTGSKGNRAGRSEALPLLVVVAALLLLALLAAVLPKAARGPSVATPTSPLPTATHTPTATPRPTRTATFTPQPTATPTFTPLPPIVHVVEAGEVLGSIAEKYDVTSASILEANGLDDPDLIRVGQELLIPRPTPTLQPEPDVPPTVVSTGGPTSTPSGGQETSVPSGELMYTVQEGDTLSGIAQEFDISVNLLMSRNGITDPTLLRVGQTLFIPRGTPTPSPTATFRPTRTATPGPPYAPPVLLWPPNGTVYRGVERTIFLQWTGVGLLAQDEWYVVRLERAGRPVHEEWTKANAWRIPAELRPDPEAADHKFTWEVSVMRQEGPEPGRGEVLVSAGETRWFEWY